MAAILNFRNFRKNCKTQKCLYLKNRARYSYFDKIFDPQDISAEYFQKIFVSPKMAAILNFQNFRKNAYISKNVLDRFRRNF